jgi:hypothetical protein
LCEASLATFRIVSILESDPNVTPKHDPKPGGSSREHEDSAPKGAAPILKSAARDSLRAGRDAAYRQATKDLSDLLAATIVSFFRKG